MIDGKLAIWIIFNRPADFPDRKVFTVDLVEVGAALRLGERCFADSLGEARAIIRKFDPTTEVRMPRDPEDVTCSTTITS